MKLRVQILWLIASFFLFVTACKKVDVNFGNEFIDGSTTKIYKIDTFAVDLSTVVLDSFSTNGQNTVSVGYYDDPSFGRINTAFYAQVVLPSYENIYANTTFDSICLVLKPNANYYGDTTKPLNIKVHEVADDIKFDGEALNIFNNKTYPVKSSILADADYLIRPKTNVKNEVYIRLNDALGIDWLNKLKASPSDSAMKDPNEFIKYFKGIRVSSSTSSNLIAGFTDNYFIRLYYKKTGVFIEEKFVDFTVYNKQLQFQNTTADRRGTDLQGLGGTNNEISSLLTNNRAYSQKATGVLTKLKFTNIKDVLKLNGFAKIVRADLVLKPINTTYTPQFYLPPAMKLATTSTRNEIGPELAVLNPDGSLAPQYGNLQVDYYLGQNTRYTYDLTQLFRVILPDNNYDVNKSGLMFLPPTPQSEVNFARTVIGDRKNLDYRAIIELYYIGLN
ncbi:MAG: DUF4270 family protein [Chitinophagaceae bacterium]